MPVKPKPPTPVTGRVDVPASPRTSADADSSGTGTAHLAPDPFLRKTPGTTPETAGGTPETSVAAATTRVHVHESTSVSTGVSTTEAPGLQQYLIPASSALPAADAEGFRTFKGRQYADIQDGGTVLLAVDPQTGLHRARLASELQPSGPALAFDPASNHWFPLQDFSASTPQAVMPRKSRRSPRRSDDEFELALEELPRNDDGASEQFYLASESMPIKPYTAQELNLMRSETRYSFLGNQLGTYNRANNGKYPLRDTAGRPIRIRKLQTKVRFENGDLFTSEQIKPYIKYEGYEDVAMLYEEKLQWRLFTEADVKVPGEKALIGQSMVVANRRLAKGEVIGVYGGAITPARFVQPYEQTFSMLAGVRLQYGPGQMLPDPLAILGDNIISRINSNFEYDAAGKPVRQARGGYNVETVPFDIEAQQWVGKQLVTKDFILNAVFASQDIPAGTELRLDYNYTEQQMSWAFP
ncbi:MULTISPECIES: SET domain-containing protein [unclassified Pseudomonas]|uniref:SET domain-containing protein n=1 Tax=unclassified Pseudomonas TaxID=196821 RepID=UPI001F595A23|nr:MULTISPECIES: SET domain-containing protein [unclassified Pseudomonas]